MHPHLGTNLREIPTDPLARLERVEALIDAIENELARPVEYLDPPAAAAFMSFSEAQLAQWRSCGNGGPRYFRLGRKILYPVRDLRAFIESEGQERQP